jgi:hypothetical protein
MPAGPVAAAHNGACKEALKQAKADLKADLLGGRADPLGVEKELDRYEGLSALKIMVPVKNVISCYLLGPVILGECRSERRCLPWMNALLMVIDVLIFSVHLLLGIKRRSYRERMQSYNFYILLVVWSLWNLFSHPLCRQYVFDLFVESPEIHVTINVAAIVVCSSTIMALPSMRHLIGLVTWEFLISLVLSSIEVMNFTMDSGWLAVVRLDIVMFNVAILLMGSTIIVGSMTVEKDIKNLAHEMEHRLGPAGTFEDDLERRKHAVLTALCDAVLTTSANFIVYGSDDGADRIFRRPMLNELLTDYLKDEAEKERFLAAVKKQFPEDASIGEGPKRMRVMLRDADDESFEADVVVSDASTDKDGKVNKYMVGMHIRGEHRARALEDPKNKSRTGHQRSGHRLEGDREKRAENKDPSGEYRQNAMYHELNLELLAAFENVLRPSSLGTGIQCGVTESSSMTSSLKLGGGTNGGGSHPGPPRYHTRRATCEVFRRQTLPSASRSGERHVVDLRRLSLPESSGGLA